MFTLLYAKKLFLNFFIYKKYSIITVAILAPIFTYIINEVVINFTDYRIGVELIILNGLLTFIGLWLVSSNRQKELN